MNTLISRIFLRLLSEPADSVHFQIALYILTHLSEMESMPIQKLAEDCFVSTSVILKFCRSYGYRSYSAFRAQLINTTAIRRRQIGLRMEKADPQTYLRLLEDMARPFDKEKLMEQVETLAQAMIDAKSLQIIGAAFPCALSLQFAEDCTVLGIPVMVFQPEDVELLRAAKERTQFPVGLIYSLSGRWIHSDASGFEKALSLFDSAFVMTPDPGESLPLAIDLPLALDEGIPNIICLTLLDFLFCSIYDRL